MFNFGILLYFWLRVVPRLMHGFRLYALKQSVQVIIDIIWIYLFDILCGRWSFLWFFHISILLKNEQVGYSVAILVIWLVYLCKSRHRHRHYCVLFLIGFVGKKFLIFAFCIIFLIVVLWLLFFFDLPLMNFLQVVIRLLFLLDIIWMLYHIDFMR
jgi:hypothetical protein